ncbi:MAG TPA: NADH-quinone oxidoreductase subunit C [Anaeromyxobacter sp.]|nr:NADH-quinone oxidoreductase subunit C [Anaeromyxobacter sp.]
MTDLEEIAREIDPAAEWEEASGSAWLRPGTLDVPHMATVMLAHGARFVTITALPESEPGSVLFCYHWDLDGELLTVETRTEEGHIASIRERCPAADWIEREIHDCFAVEFEGGAQEPLLLRPGQAPGVGLRGEEE